MEHSQKENLRGVEYTISPPRPSPSSIADLRKETQKHNEQLLRKQYEIIFNQ